MAGRTDILEQLDFDATRRAGTEKVYHPGTFNANPLSAAAGIATLRIIAGSDACIQAEATAVALRAGLNAALAGAGVPWAVYGRSTAFHVFMSPAGKTIDPERFDAATQAPDDLKQKPAETVRLLRLAMLVNGVDLSGWPGGLVSAVHGAGEVSETVEAWAESLAMLQGVSGGAVPAHLSRQRFSDVVGIVAVKEAHAFLGQVLVFWIDDVMTLAVLS